MDSVLVANIIEGRYNVPIPNIRVSSFDNDPECETSDKDLLEITWNVVIRGGDQVNLLNQVIYQWTYGFR